MNLLHLLKGNDVKAQDRLNELIKQHTNELKLLWYPSAGFDFRDVDDVIDNIEHAVTTLFNYPDIVLLLLAG